MKRPLTRPREGGAGVLQDALLKRLGMPEADRFCTLNSKAGRDALGRQEPIASARKSHSAAVSSRAVE